MLNKKYLLFLIPLILSLLIVYISFNYDFWIDFWSFFKVPSQIPPFADLDAISRALKSKLDGFNPYYNNPYDLAKKQYSYPSVWLYLFDFLRLEIDRNFQIFCFIIIYIYFFVFLKILIINENKVYQTLLVLIFFSTSNLLALERLNTDIIIFILIYFLASSNNYTLKISLFFLSLYAKLFPIFAVFIFVTKKFFLVSIIFLSLLSLFLMKEEILLMLGNGIEYALLASHGIPSLTRGFWYYSTRYDFFINDDNYLLFKYFSMFLGSIYAFMFFKLNFKFGAKKINKKMSLIDSLFICGSGIYIGRFITFGNFDYALIFLIFTFPYFFKVLDGKLKLFLFLIFIICFNSLYLETGARYNLFYFSKASIIHFLKIIIFTFNCYFFGKILNNHLEIKFKN